jgi:hypothetical protein
MSLKQSIENNLTIWTLAMVVAGFSAGFGAYKAMLDATNQTTVVRGTFVATSAVVGKILKVEVTRELGYLIETGKEIDAKKDPAKAGVFLARTRAFLIGLDLPKDKDYQGTPLSSPVFDHQMIMMKSSWFGHDDITLPEQVARVVGLLQGLKSSYSARAGGA